MAGELNVLCAGAVKGLVLALQSGFERASGAAPARDASAPSARCATRCARGAPCDVFIATDAMIDSLQASGELRAGDGSARSAACRRRSRCKASAPPPTIDSAESLKAALLARQRDLLPRRDAVDRRRARRRDARAARHPRRARVAPAHVRQRRDRDARARRAPTSGAIGCTQATEIRYTPGLALVGALPAPFALATVYSAAVADASARRRRRAPLHRSARRARRAPRLRRAGGFDEAAASATPS